jgi:cation transport ATPase
MNNMNDETLLEEVGENLLEENDNNAEAGSAAKQNQLLEQLQKELEAAKKQREEMEKKTKELEAERRKVEAERMAETEKKRKEETEKKNREKEAKRKKAEAERMRVSAIEAKKKEAQQRQMEEEKRKKKERQKKIVRMIVPFLPIFIHFAFLLWMALDFSNAVKSVFFWLGVIVSGLISYFCASIASDDNNNEAPFNILMGGWGLFVLYAIIKGFMYLYEILPDHLF